MTTTLRLQWPASPANELVTGYQVWRSLDGGEFEYVATTANTYADTVNPSANVFAFKVKAVNFVGAGPFSPVAQGPGLPSAPGQPTLTVTITNP
jgi:hypothetical protein